MATNDPDMFEYYLKSLDKNGTYSFRVGGETLEGAITRIGLDYFELNVTSKTSGSGRDTYRIPFRAVQSVK